MNWMEQAADGWVLEWQPHFLARQVEDRGAAVLAEEPTLRKAAGAHLIGLRRVAGGLALSGNGWFGLRVTALPWLEGQAGGGDSLTWSPLPDFLRWEELPPGQAYELTPVEADGRSGGTRLLVRPPEVPVLPWQFSYRLEPAVDRVTCEPVRAADVTGFTRIRLEVLQLVAHGRFERVGPGAEVGPGGGGRPCPPRLRGVVAVVGERGGGRYLLDCKSIDDRSLAAPPAAAEWRAVAQTLGCRSTAVRQWPTRSHERLEAIRRLAAEAGLRHGLLRRHPRGAVRYLVLQVCGSVPGLSEEVIRGLDAEVSFETALENSGLAAPLLRLRQADDLAWRWPDLAATIGKGSGLEQQAGVELFLQLVEPLAAELRRWPARSCLAEEGGLEALLSTPDHPLIGAAHAEAVTLTGHLDGMDGLPTQPPGPPLRPAALTHDGFAAWWGELRALDARLDDLRDRAGQIQARSLQAQRLLERLLESGAVPSAHGSPELIRALLVRAPESFSYSELTDLLEAIRKIEGHAYGKR